MSDLDTILIKPNYEINQVVFFLITLRIHIPGLSESVLPARQCSWPVQWNFLLYIFVLCIVFYVY